MNVNFSMFKTSESNNSIKPIKADIYEYIAYRRKEFEEEIAKIEKIINYLEDK